MKCSNIENWILLNDANELPQKYRKPLTQHLETCESCQAFEKLLHDSRMQPAHEPPQALVDQILREARQQTPKKAPKTLLFIKPFSLALAATVLIAIGISFFHPKHLEQQAEFVITESQILTVDYTVSSILEDTLTEDDQALNFLMTYDG